MITLIGTAHILNLSQVLIKIFDEKQPDMICIELDSKRYNVLINRDLQTKNRDTPALYKFLAWFQEKLAREYGVTAGDEMITAIKYAEEHDIPFSMIDMDAQLLFTRMLKSMSILEKIRLIFSGLLSLLIGKKQVEKELDYIEENFNDFLQEVNKKYPTIKKVLIDERNEFMAKKLIELSKEYQDIIAIVGEGHIPGISSILRENNIEVETIRLSTLREMKPIEVKSNDTTSISFTVEQEIPEHIDLKNKEE